MSERTWQLPAGLTELSPHRRKWIALHDPRLSVLDLGIYLVISETHPSVYAPWQLADRGYAPLTVADIQRSLDHLTGLDYLESYK